MSYTPPAGDSLEFVMANGYVPPAGDAIAFDMSGPAPPETSLRMSMLQLFSLPDRVVLAQSFSLLDSLRLELEQPLSLPDRMVLHQIFGDADKLRKTIYHVFGDTRSLRRQWWQRFGDAILVRQVLEQVFSMPDLLRLVLQQDFAMAADSLRLVTEQVWSIDDVDQLRQTIYQVYGLLGAQAEHLSYAVTTTVDGVLVDNPAGITIERDIELYYIDCELEIAGQATWARYSHGSVVELSVNGISYTLMVTAPRRERRHGGSRYMVTVQSPAVQLGHGYAETVDGELTGFASQIAAALAPGFVIDWQIQDEYYGPGQLIAAGEYPIELIAKLAAAMKGVVQSLPDGSLAVIYRRPVRVDRRDDVEPDYILSDAEDFFTASETPERREGYNRYTVGNQAEASVGLRLEEEQISDTVKLARGYQTPWTGNFDLTHTGGDWVILEPLGIEERTETETVEFVDGEGQTRYPLYSWSELEWREVNLGTITFSEDGSLTATVTGDSLLELTYTTKCKKWRVRDPRNEQLQLVSEDDA